MKLPAPRGPLGASLTDLLVHPPRDTDAVDDEVLTRWRDAAAAVRPADGRRRAADALDALRAALPRLRGRGRRVGVGPGPAAAARGPRGRVRGRTPRPGAGAASAAAEREAVAAALFAMTAPTRARASPATSAGPRTRRRSEEFLVHRSLYTLKEADPHTWAIPRLHGAAKAALVEIQADEYGGGGPSGCTRAVRPHDARRRARRRYGAYVDQLPGRHDRRAERDVAVRAAPPAGAGRSSATSPRSR